MLFNYLLVALRNLNRNRGFSFINIAGLAIGLASSMLIGLWVYDETQMNTFNTNLNRIFRVMEHQQYAAEVMTTTSTPGLLADALMQEVPEVEAAATTTWNEDHFFRAGEKVFKEKIIWGGKELFRIFSFPLISGDSLQVIARPNTMVISEKVALRWFGSTDVIGKSVVMDNSTSLEITGVFKNIPKTSALEFDAVLPFDDFKKENAWLNEWGNNGPQTWALLREGANGDSVSAKIAGFVKKKNEGSHVTLFLHPLAKAYLWNRFEDGKLVGGRIEYVRLFGIIAIAVLLIACINFMNLSTARALKRAREVGVRKSIGAGRPELVGQFLGESAMITAFSTLLAVLLMAAFLPYFDRIALKELHMPWTSGYFWLAVFGVMLVTSVVAGAYPALYLSGFSAIKALRSALKGSPAEQLFRKTQVVFQFVICVMLISSTIVVYRQVDHMHTLNLGYNKENMITFWLSGEAFSKFEPFAAELRAHPGVVSVSRASTSLLYRNSNTYGLDWTGKNPEDRILFENIRVDHDFIPTLGMNLVSGRNFNREFSTDTASVILNEAAIRVMNLQKPLDETIKIWGQDRKVIGVLQDFNYMSAQFKIEPAFILLRPEQSWNCWVRFHSGSAEAVIGALKETWEKFNPGYDFEYRFADERFGDLYKSETRTRDLAMLFSALAIIISCLGLFGLSMYTAEQRKREISVRKVLGASSGSILVNLSKDISVLVSISVIIAVPLTIYLMNSWLKAYEFRVELGFGTFAAVIAGTFLLAWLTILYQSMRATQANPADVLKYE